VPREIGQEEGKHMNLNQLTIIPDSSAGTPKPGNCRTARLSLKFSVATTRSWKDDNREWKNKTQWHTVCGFGQGVAQMPPVLLADDPGAGKTIMAGLLIKELLIRGDLHRCLVVCPGNLVEQWHDELLFAARPVTHCRRAVLLRTCIRCRNDLL
jgi:hypothetical protein